MAQDEIVNNFFVRTNENDNLLFSFFNLTSAQSTFIVNLNRCTRGYS